MTQSEVAEAVGVTQPTYQALESGKAEKTAYLTEFARALRVNINWLATGDGDMRSSNIIIESGEVEGFLPIPVYDIYFCCGDGNNAHIEFEEIKEVRNMPPSFFTKRGIKPQDFKLVCAQNDSMLPYIAHDDEVGIVITETEVRDGEIYAILLDGERMFKQIFREAGGVLRLHSFNSSYPDKIVTSENGQSLKIVGRQVYRAG